MAEGDIINVDIGSITAGAGVAVEMLVNLGLVAIIIGALWLIWYLLSFKNKLIIRDLVNGRKIVRHNITWKEWKDKNGVVWLITPFKKMKKPLPPAEAIDITPKGKKFVEAWRGEDSDTLVWVKDNFDYENFKADSGDQFQPLITQERELLANEIVKGYSYEKKDTWTRIAQLLPWLVPVIMVIVIAVTIEDVTGSLQEFTSGIIGPMTKVAEGFERAADKLGEVQTPPSELTILEEVPN